MDADAGTLILTDKRNSLIAWFNLYMGIEAGDPDSNTFKAKQSDLSRFIGYFRRVTGSDHPDQWTRSVSQGFLKDLLRAKSERTGRKLAPTTANRVLATLRNTARWIHHQRAFLAGYPMDRISDVSMPEPEWRGLADVDVTRLKAAAEQLIHIHTRGDQNGQRDQAMLLVMLDTAFRVSELVSLDLDQYEGKHFRNVKRKGNHVSDRVFVGQAAREALDRYVRDVRGEAPGPLFQSKRGRRLAVQNVADALGRIVAQANTRLPDASSANMFGQLSPTTAAHVAAPLAAQVDMILDGGPCSVGVESTIISFCHDRPTLLRPGGVPVEAIEAIIGPLAFLPPDEAPSLSPGRLPKHYAPRTPLVLAGEGGELPEIDGIGMLCLQQPDTAPRCAAVETLSPSGDLREAAANLYSALERLDAQGLKAIVAFAPPETGFGRAIADRLRRASGSTKPGECQDDPEGGRSEE